MGNIGYNSNSNRGGNNFYPSASRFALRFRLKIISLRGFFRARGKGAEVKEKPPWVREVGEIIVNKK